MLRRLKVENYALIESIEIELIQGLNVLTGETGAGKSLLIGAISLAQGKRADSLALSNRGTKCIVELEFQFKNNPAPLSKHKDADWYESDLNESLIIRREITASGKSRAFINDTPVLLEDLRHLSEELIDLHGQHEGQKILDQQIQINALDSYAGIETRVQSYAELFEEYKNISTKINKIKEKLLENKKRIDYLEYQISELKQANLIIGEEEELERELQVLHHTELLGTILHGAIHVLDRDEQSITNRLVEQVKSLNKAAAHYNLISNEIEKIDQARILIADAIRELEIIINNVEANPKRQIFVEERLALYHSLKIKYAAKSVEELITILDQHENELLTIVQSEDQLNQLENRSNELIHILVPLGNEIENERKNASHKLSEEVTELLRKVGFIKGIFEIQVYRLVSEGTEIQNGIFSNSKGFNSVQFLIRTNPGQPLAPLKEIASGGEISRVTLAIKAAMARNNDSSVMIFDEIDTGISGEIALKVGYVMEELAESQQMIVISHLPQIASRGNRHFKIYKEIINDNTFSRIKELSHEERIIEIATMMSSEKPTANALQSAWELISLNNKKNG